MYFKLGRNPRTIDSSREQKKKTQLKTGGQIQNNMPENKHQKSSIHAIMDEHQITF